MLRRNKYIALGVFLIALVVAVTLGGPDSESGAVAATMSHDPDFESIAQLLVRDSVQVKDMERVVLVGDAQRIPLMESIAVEVAKRGGFPHLILSSPTVGKRILTEASVEYLGRADAMAIAELKHTDVSIVLSANEDPTLLTKVPEERVALARKSSEAYSKALFVRPLRSVSLGNPAMPSATLARFHGVPLADMERQFWAAVNTPPSVLGENAGKVKKALTAGRKIRIKTAAGTDLRFELAGRKVLVNDGKVHQAPVDAPELIWLPAGEVYTTPQASSVNGTVMVPLVNYRGIKIKDLKLVFKAGKVTTIEATQNAEALKQALAQSSGDKDIFSFLDIGVNPNNRMFKNSDYCTWTMAGMVTIGIGSAPWSETPNQSDFSQEFFIPHATLEIDGTAIVKEGKLAG